ncbi:MAG: hypothetical protein ABI678_24875, partial [Kofleriaceae bacterium]
MRWCVLLFALFAACKKDATPPAGGSAGSASAPVAAAGVRILVDGKEVATVTPAQLAQWPRVDTLVPTDARRLGRWQDLDLAGGARPTTIHSPSGTYPDLVPALFPGEAGSSSFGMFDPVELAKKGKPSLREDHITSLSIKLLPEDAGRGQHEQGQGGGKDPAKLKITFVTPKGTTVLDGAKLLAIPRDNVPGTTDAKGWTLQTILTAGGIQGFDKLVVSNANGVALNLGKDAFTATSIPFVKLNRKG